MKETKHQQRCYLIQQNKINIEQVIEKSLAFMIQCTYIIGEKIYENNIEDQQLVPYSSVQGKVGGLAIPILGFGVQFINEHIWMFAIFIGILVAEFLLSNIKSDKISVSEKGREHEDNDKDLAH